MATTDKRAFDFTIVSQQFALRHVRDIVETFEQMEMYDGVWNPDGTNPLTDADLAVKLFKFASTHEEWEAMDPKPMLPYDAAHVEKVVKGFTALYNTLNTPALNPDDPTTSIRSILKKFRPMV